MVPSKGRTVPGPRLTWTQDTTRRSASAWYEARVRGPMISASRRPPSSTRTTNFVAVSGTWANDAGSSSPTPTDSIPVIQGRRAVGTVRARSARAFVTLLR
ncbi:hypothetical protein SALBM311S_06977 [Streptomyces alboniger]